MLHMCKTWCIEETSKKDPVTTCALIPLSSCWPVTGTLYTYVHGKYLNCTKILAQIMNSDNGNGLKTPLNKCYRFVVLDLPL